MTRTIINVLIVLVLFVTYSQALCPSFIRLINAIVPNPLQVDFNINGTVYAAGVDYKTATGYFSVTPGVLNVFILQAGTSNNIGIRTFTAAPGFAYTVAVTGSLASANGNLLFTSTPFVYIDNIQLPTPGTFRGTFYRLAESNSTQNFQVLQQTYTANTPYVDPKTSSAFANQQPGSITFRVTDTSGNVIINSVGNAEQIHAVIGSEVLFDTFLIGDDSNAINPASFSTASNSPTYDPVSGCVLFPGTNILPNPTPQPPIFSFVPCNSAVSFMPFMTVIVAFLLALFS